MTRKPSSSMCPISPVCNQPSSIAAAVASGAFQYPCMTIGVIPVPIYPTSTPDQIVHIVTDAGVRVIITAGPKELDRILEARDQMPGLETVILINPADQVGDHDGLTVLSLEQVRQAGVSEEIQTVVEERMGQSCPDDVAALIYTSGTTGEPKGVMISHRAALAELQALDAFFDVTPADHSLSFLPLSHALEWGWSMAVIRHGCLNTFVPNPKTISAMLAEVRPTLFVSVPKLYEQVMSVAREKVSDSPAKLKIFEWSIRIGPSSLMLGCVSSSRLVPRSSTVFSRPAIRCPALRR
jgi:long-chain acyl-CoA synthetase